MGNTSISKNLKKTTAVLLRDGTVLEGVNYGQFRAGVKPTSTDSVIEETVAEKKERLLKELAELE